MKHTKTPWEIRSGGEVGTDEKMTAAIFPVTGEENKANAAFIVKAVNNHERLLGILKDIAKTIEASDEWWMDCPDKGGFDLELIEEIIRQAEAE